MKWNFADIESKLRALHFHRVYKSDWVCSINLIWHLVKRCVEQTITYAQQKLVQFNKSAILCWNIEAKWQLFLCYKARTESLSTPLIRKSLWKYSKRTSQPDLICDSISLYQIFVEQSQTSSTPATGTTEILILYDLSRFVSIKLNIFNLNSDLKLFRYIFMEIYLCEHIFLPSPIPVSSELNVKRQQFKGHFIDKRKKLLYCGQHEHNQQGWCLKIEEKKKTEVKPSYITATQSLGPYYPTGTHAENTST